MARPRGNIDERIVRAARVLFLRDGVDGASLREIARRARTSIGMIYYYFPTKDDLFLAVVEQVYAKLLTDLATALGSAATSEGRIRALYARIAVASEDELDVVRLIVREALVSSDRRTRILERFSRGHMPLLLGALAQGVEAGEVAAHPLAALMMTTVAVGLVPQMVRRLMGDKEPFASLPQGEELGSSLADLLFEGLRPRDRQRPSRTIGAATARSGPKGSPGTCGK